MASKKITVSSLDFDEIRTNLKSYLSGQTVFQDYDFDGSALSVLIDILAYNTHYNALYNNLAINEMFIDSARKRNSVVSIARQLGYTPQSAKCSTATVNITCNYSGGSFPYTYVIPANSPFTTTVDNVTYTFYNESALSYGPTSSSTYTFTGVKLIERANRLTHAYTVADGVRFYIPNQFCDISTIKVSVQDYSGSSNTTPFSLVDTVINVDGTSTVYWLKEQDDNQYELIFGDGVLGKALVAGNVVNITYDVSSLDYPNGARTFTFPNQGSLSYNVVTTSAASGGSVPEDIESIRFNAPRSFQTLDRAVTTNDYKSIIYSNFLAAKSIAAWGGENNYPPVYGKTFICVKPKSADYLTTAQKEDITNNILASRNLPTVGVEIVDPEYINVVINTTVYYNNLLTTRTAESIKTVVMDAINNYNETELQQFDGVLRYSKLSRIIDTCESSIINNITTLYLKRYLTPKYNINANYTLNLLNPIYYSGAAEDIVKSSGFYINGDTKVHYLVDDGLGNMMLYYVDGTGTRYVVNPSIGTVDYTKGIVTIVNLNISALVDNYFVLYIKPSSNDVVSTLNQIVQISMDELSINVIHDKTASGDLGAGQNYIFTTSRN